MNDEIVRFWKGLAGVSSSYIVFRVFLAWLDMRGENSPNYEFLFGYHVGYNVSVYVFFCIVIWLFALAGTAIFVGRLNRARARASFFWSTLSATVILVLLEFSSRFNEILELGWIRLFICGFILSQGVLAYLGEDSLEDNEDKVVQ